MLVARNGPLRFPTGPQIFTDEDVLNEILCMSQCDQQEKIACMVENWQIMKMTQSKVDDVFCQLDIDWILDDLMSEDPSEVNLRFLCLSIVTSKHVRDYILSEFISSPLFDEVHASRMKAMICQACCVDALSNNEITWMLDVTLSLPDALLEDRVTLLFCCSKSLQQTSICHSVRIQTEIEHILDLYCPDRMWEIGMKVADMITTVAVDVGERLGPNPAAYERWRPLCEIYGLEYRLPDICQLPILIPYNNLSYNQKVRLSNPLSE